MSVADMINPETGKTGREENNSKAHKYKVGQAVKIEECRWAFITKLTRDCDGTPLYSYESVGLSEDSITDSLD
jgi:hypothetical protein